MTIETEVVCLTCGSHRITAILRGATIDDVEIVRIQKGDMPEELSRVYECGKDPSDDKTSVLQTFYQIIDYMRPTPTLIRMVLLYHETGLAKPIERILERCSYPMFFETLADCIERNEVSAPRLSLSERIWHPAKPPNEYRSATIDHFLHQSILDQNTTVATITGLLPILFAYYFPNIPASIHNAISQRIERVSREMPFEWLRHPEQIDNDSRWWFYYKLRNNMQIDHETIREMGFSPSETILEKTRIYETEQV